MIRLNVLLWAQSAVVTTAAAPAGLSSGAWFTLGSLLLTIGGVIYKVGQASQRAATVESLVAGELTFVKDALKALLEEVQHERVENAAWKADVIGRVRVLEGDPPIHIHHRASDR